MLVVGHSSWVMPVWLISRNSFGEDCKVPPEDRSGILEYTALLYVSRRSSSAVTNKMQFATSVTFSTLISHKILTNCRLYMLVAEVPALSLEKAGRYTLYLSTEYFKNKTH